MWRPIYMVPSPYLEREMKKDKAKYKWRDRNWLTNAVHSLPDTETFREGVKS